MIDVEVEDKGWRVIADVEALVERAALAALDDANAGIVVLLGDDEAVADLNARFRGKTGPTNVLSFPAPATAAPHLGDLVLAHGVCVREAQAQGKSLADHLVHLVVHGVLHLRGRDHQDDQEAERMEAEERAILAGLGVTDPYGAERSRA